MCEKTLTTFRWIAVALLLLTATTGCDFVRSVQDQFVTEAPEEEFVPPPSKHGDVPVEFKTENEEIISAKQFMELTWEQELQHTQYSLKNEASRKVFNSFNDYRDVMSRAEERVSDFITSLEDDPIKFRSWPCISEECRARPSKEDEPKVLRDRLINIVWDGKEPTAIAEDFAIVMETTLGEYEEDSFSLLENALILKLWDLGMSRREAEDLVTKAVLTIDERALEAAVHSLVTKPGNEPLKSDKKKLKTLHEAKIAALVENTLTPNLKAKKRADMRRTVSFGGDIAILAATAFPPATLGLAAARLTKIGLALVAPDLICTATPLCNGGLKESALEDKLHSFIQQTNQDAHAYYQARLCGALAQDSSNGLCQADTVPDMTSDYMQYRFAITDIQSRALLYAVGREIEKEQIPVGKFEGQ